MSHLLSIKRLLFLCCHRQSLPTIRLVNKMSSYFPSQLETVVKAVANKQLVNDDTPSVELFDLDYFRGRISSLFSAFPEPHFVHAAALKANSVRGVLQVAREMNMGAECASIAEAVHALQLGYDADKVVYDSPCKTKTDLKRALDSNIYINLDNEREMEVVDALLSGPCSGSKSKIGLRINPVVGGGAIAIVSTATKLSKFGLPVVAETKDRIVGLYEKYKWLNCIHVHVGSQGVPMDLFVKGARACLDFTAVIEAKCGRSLDNVDIGGGLSTTYTEEDEPKEFTYQLYREKLEKEVPELFTGKYRVFTEFGRSLFLKAGKTLTRVENVKEWIPGVQPIVLTHVGTNQFIREAYLPATWRHRFSLAGPDGTIKKGDKVKHDLAGPLCFQGDYLAKDVELPPATPGDILVIHDTGAYTMNMYSKFNSILPSPIYGFSKGKGQGQVDFVCFKERETPEETLQFWGSDEPRRL